MDQHDTTTIYEPPALVELGEFTEDTLGSLGVDQDSYSERFGF